MKLDLAARDFAIQFWIFQMLNFT